ncbi:IPT/TIG domain-containing protein [Aquiflexum sp.]|uniref:IPT/TIG domain-containing protein n=1 Tax=Aquiflexum sp. TaxID=1872584 RepID=UPI0035935A9C
MLKNLFRYIFVLITILTIGGCEEAEDPTFSILTEEIVNVSGERAIVLGRLIAFENIPFEDHGFYFSRDENFNQPIILNLGETSRPGRFLGEIDGLELGAGYFVKAFGIKEGQVAFGNTLSFSTLDPALERFTPMTQFPGEEIIIFGINFGDDTEVYFGGQKAQVIEVAFGFRIRVRVPPMTGNPTVEIKIITRGIELIATEPFNYATGVYENLGVVTEDFVLVDNIYFQQGNRFFAGLGIDLGARTTNHIWEYTPGQNAWQRTAFTGITQRKAANSRTGFFGGGEQMPQVGAQILNNTFWHFDGNNFNSIPTPPISIVDGLGFMAQGRFYIVGGTFGIGSQVYRYDPFTTLWQLRPNLPYDVDKSMVHFVHNDLLYIINKDKALLRYNLETAQSTMISEYPSPFIENFSDTGGLSVVVGDKVYIGLYDNNEDMWELDMNTLIWSKKNRFTGTPSGRIVAAFESEGFLYFLRIYAIPRRMEFWKFDPNGF